MITNDGKFRRQGEDGSSGATRYSADITALKWDKALWQVRQDIDKLKKWGIWLCHHFFCFSKHVGSGTLNCITMWKTNDQKCLFGFRLVYGLLNSAIMCKHAVHTCTLWQKSWAQTTEFSSTQKCTQKKAKMFFKFCIGGRRLSYDHFHQNWKMGENPKNFCNQHSEECRYVLI